MKHGVYLGDGLVYDQKELPTPLEFPTACVAVVKFSGNIELGQGYARLSMLWIILR